MMNTIAPAIAPLSGSVTMPSIAATPDPDCEAAGAHNTPSSSTIAPASVRVIATGRYHVRHVESERV